MKKTFNVMAGIAVYCTCVLVLTGWGHRETHPYLNDIISLNFLAKFEKSDFADKLTFKNYEFNWNNGSAPVLTGTAYEDEEAMVLAPTEVTRKYEPMKWISEGGWMEDEPWGPASLCHFYDPIAVTGLRCLTDCSGVIELYPILRQFKEYSSVDARAWATDHPDHPYSWEKAKRSMIQAMQESNPELKKEKMALAYRSLGHVLHLVCDMGCPPHVRNDSHPPKILWGMMGDPDPVEEICKRLSPSELWKLNPPDSYLKNYVDANQDFREIFHSLAMHTNSRYFSGQTIHTDRYTPVIRPRNPYPDPFLSESDYKTDTYTYSKSYNGVNVMMCKDKSPVWFDLFAQNKASRARPYLDAECVESIASAVYPNIAEAGANVIRVFIPRVAVELIDVKLDSGGIIRGKVVPVMTLEYAALFDRSNIYSGEVRLFLNKTDAKVTTVARNGSFEFKLKGKPTLKKDDLVMAKIEFGGIVVKSDPYKAEGKMPQIESLSKARGVPGEDLFITGKNFGNDKSVGEVYFTGAIAREAALLNWSDGQIVVTIPELAETGTVKVKVGQDFSNEMIFGVPPQISSLSMTSGKPGDPVTIEGLRFGDNASEGSVLFSGAPCTEITLWTATKITAAVPLNATSGDVVVKVRGEESNKVWFTIAGPQITSIEPGHASVGDPITINGKGFGNDRRNGEVWFNDVKTAELTVWTDTSIDLKVPAGAESGVVVVRVSGVQSNQYPYNITEKTPVITSTSPVKQEPGRTLEITGTNFGNDNSAGSIDFNGININGSTTLYWSDTRISLKVPDQARSGFIYVIVNGVRSNAWDFKVRRFYYQRTGTVVQNTNASSTDIYKGDAVFGSNYAEFLWERLNPTPDSPYGKYKLSGSWVVPPEKFSVTDTVTTTLTAKLDLAEGKTEWNFVVQLYLDNRSLGHVALGSSNRDEKYEELTIKIARSSYGDTSDPYYLLHFRLTFICNPWYTVLGQARTAYDYELKEEN